MKDVSSVETLDVPEGVTVQIKARKVTVEGPRGKLTKDVGHVQMDLQLVSWGFRILGLGSGCVSWSDSMDGRV
jgi:ribosomal protein L6P/L9E